MHANTRKKQHIKTKQMNSIKTLNIVFLTLALGTTACGIKPAHVEPPKGAEHDEFPRTYPDPSTDPKPGMERKSF